MTRSPSTTSRAGSVMLEPTSPGSLSTVTTSSSATFSCLPPQRTIAYTRELSLSFALPSVPWNSGITTAGSLERAYRRPRRRAHSRRLRLPDVGTCTNPGRSAARGPVSATAHPALFVRFIAEHLASAEDLVSPGVPNPPHDPESPRSFRTRATRVLLMRRVRSVVRALGGTVLGGGHIGGAVLGGAHGHGLRRLRSR